MVQLDERLALIERMAGACTRLVDVGTNHGYLPVHMLQSGLCTTALLCDISADALSRAQRLVRVTHLEHCTQLLVADGLEGIELTNGDVVTISGMGARTIAHILDKTLPCPVIVQANVELPYLRRHMESIGMHIAGEGIALDNGRYYVVLRIEPGSLQPPLDDYQAHIGPALLRDKPPHFADYLNWRLGVTKRALRGMEVGRDEQKRLQAQRDVEDVMRALEELKK